MHVEMMKMDGWGMNDMRRWVKQAWRVLGIIVLPFFWLFQTFFRLWPFLIMLKAEYRL